MKVCGLDGHASQIYATSRYVSSTCDYRLTLKSVTLRRVQRGTYAGDVIKRLAAERGLKQADLEQRTGIGHSTMSGYWSNRLRLGDQNAPLVAAALGVSLEVLSAEVAQDAPAGHTHRLLRSLGERGDVDPDVVTALELLARRLDALESESNYASVSAE